ncbi:MAG: FAD-dependent oxidoreductase, partial [Planctomycetota bacterium]|nr:FAD-dependent oxidoreductase [Planctomycetota bacterium]
MTQAKRMVIIGGVAGGASCAARARRLSEDAEIVLIERGEYVSFANCGMPYHIGGAIVERSRLLVQTPTGLKNRYRLDVRVRTEALAIDRANKTVTLRDLATGREYAEPYDVLVLSPGAEPVRPPIPGADTEGVMTLRSMKDMDAIGALLDRRKPEHALIVGGGYIGLEMAEALRQRGLGVTLVELANQVFGAADREMAVPVQEELTRHGVRVLLETSVAGIAPAGDGISVTLSTGEVVACGLVLLAIGVKPEVGLARQAGLAIGATGGIVVDEHMRTGDASIYAVGDAVEVSQLVGGGKALIPLAGPANRQGRIAADNAFGRTSVYRSTQGTAICKIFDLCLGMTGLSEKLLVRAGCAYEKIYVHPASHAGYYPGAAQMTLKLLFDPGDGKILGAQAVGGEGVDKRIDVLAVAIRAGLTVRDLKDLEL